MVHLVCRQTNKNQKEKPVLTGFSFFIYEGDFHKLIVKTLIKSRTFISIIKC